jgi:hypothetical protein
MKSPQNNTNTVLLFSILFLHLVHATHELICTLQIWSSQKSFLLLCMNDYKIIKHQLPAACLQAGWLLLHKFNGHLETVNTVPKTGSSKTQCTLMPGHRERERGCSFCWAPAACSRRWTLESRVSGVRDWRGFL